MSLCFKCNKNEGEIDTVAVDEKLGKLVKVSICVECNDKITKQNYDEYPTVCEQCNYEIGPIYNDTKGDVSTYLVYDSHDNYLCDKRLCEECLAKLSADKDIKLVKKY